MSNHTSDADSVTDIESQQSPQLFRSVSRASGADIFSEPEHGHGAAVLEAKDGTVMRQASAPGTQDAEEDMYSRFTGRQKFAIVFILSFCAFLSPISSTSVLAATPEVAKEFHTTGAIINTSNAAYMVFMGFSPIVWGPMSQVFGRRPIILNTAIVFFLMSLGTALAPNLAAFFAFRALSAFEGTSFILLGAACIGDIYRPTERGTALGWFLSGTVSGPAFGPFLGGIIVTYSSWRTIFWLQMALAGAAGIGVYFFVPETIHRKQITALAGYSHTKKAKAVISLINPIRVITLFKHPNQLLVAAAAAALVWNMYSLLTPIRYVINPRFHLDSPLLSGLFYLAPGFGYIVGTFGGGRWADYTVKKWIKKRNGVRIPEDRLRSGLPFLGVVIPATILIYGWSVDKAVGGIPVPVIAMFVQGVAQLFAFPSVNAYCLDVMPGRSADVTAANYFLRYMAGCLVTGIVLPAIDSIGLGWFSTISAFILIISAVGIWVTIQMGCAKAKGTKAPCNGNEESTK